MKIIVLQHVAIEHPGIFRDFMRSDGLSWDTVELDEGERIPDLAPYDLMIVMGGPQDTWEEDQYPWMTAEKAAIRQFVLEMKKPYLGICLGHQLLADATGGKVGPAARPEVGVMTVEKTGAGKADLLFAGLPDTIEALQWHGAEVTDLPPNAEVLAASEACRVQSLRVGRRAYGLQFHVEISDSTVADWAAIPAYERALDRALGENAAHHLGATVSERIHALNRDAKIFYDNFMTAIRN